MKVGELNGFTFHVPTSGGKAGFGFNVTSTIQVHKGGCIVKQFRFKVDDDQSKSTAIAKAKAFVSNQLS